MTDKAVLDHPAGNADRYPGGLILSRVSDRGLRRLGYGLVGVIVAMAIVEIAISISRRWWDGLVEAILLFGLFSAVVAFALRAKPRNRAIWAMAWAAFFGSLSGLGGAVAEAMTGLSSRAIENQEVFVSPSSLEPLAALGFAIDASLWATGFMLLTIHLMVLFPGGEPPSQRWRWSLWAAGIAMAVMGVGGLIHAGPWVDTSYDELASLGSVAGPPGFAMVVLMPLAVASIIHMIVRYRRSVGEERLQYRWVMVALGFLVLNFFLFGLIPAPFADAVSTFILLLVPTAFAIAIVKYRLYDIDLVISKSLTYLGLAAVVSAVYAAVVLLPVLLLERSGANFGSGGLTLPFVATVLVAVVFEPVRRRMQWWANRLVYGQRSTPHQVLSQIASRLSDSQESSEDLAEVLAQGTGATSAVIWRKNGETLVPESVFPPDDAPGATRTDALDEFDVVSPVVHLDDTLGMVTLTKPPSDPPNPADVELVDSVAATAGLILRNEALNRQLEQRATEVRQSRQRLIAAQDAERRRLERDLHDGAQQQVVALKVKLGLAQKLAEREGARDLADSIATLADETQDAVDAMRTVAHGIYPPLLEAEGLRAALTALQRTAPVALTVSNGDVPRYGQRIEQTAYFFVSEAVDRAHMAGARNVHIALAEADGLLGITLDHDGRSTIDDVGAIADRIEAFGGTATTEVVTSGRSRTVVAIPSHERGET